VTDRIRVDTADLTLGELADAGELLGIPLQDAMTGLAQPKAIAALVCVIVRRTDPSYTLDQALQLHMRDIDLVQTDPEVSAGNNGGGPALSPASGS
jgi:hypothetical protein